VVVQWFAILLIGALVGFLGGLFGKGGSSIATPLLALIGLPPLVAIASPLPATVPGTLVAYRRYRRGGVFDAQVVLWSVAFGVPSTILGAAASQWISGAVLITITDVVLACVGARVLLSAGRGVEQLDPSAPHGRLRLALVGITVGLLAGLLANAGGFLLVPLYLGVLKIPLRPALGSSLAVACALALPGTIVHAGLGQVNWTVAIAFGLASIPLSGLGARTALRMNSVRLERIYGAGLLVLGAVLLVV